MYYSDEVRITPFFELEISFAAKRVPMVFRLFILCVLPNLVLVGCAASHESYLGRGK